MKALIQRALVLGFLAVSAQAQSPSPSPAPITFPLEWKPLEGWRSETIPFPLDFAPGLDYPGGVEELRFAPGFGKVEDPLYFTYAFVWVVPGSRTIDLVRVSQDLKAYFDGLMTAVAKDGKIDLGAVDSQVKLEQAADDSSGLRFKGEVTTVDAFFSRKPLTLEIAIHETTCKVTGMKVWYFEVSPKLSADETRTLMARVRKALGC